MSTSAQKQAARTGLLGQHSWFDSTFIVGTLVLAFGLTGVASLSPAMLITVVLIDTWLFANPHVVATFTRIGASLAHVRRYRFLIFGLPVIVLGGVVATALAYEISGLFTLYFVAQSYHVARQSFGIARAYRRSGSAQPFRADWLSETLIYMVAAWGLLARCAESSETFLGYPIELPAVPTQVADVAGIATLVCGAWWLWRLAHRALAREIDWRHDGFVASHVCAHFAAYIWITDITLGWLVINLWHNLQYLQFVWVQNIRRNTEKSSERTSTMQLWKSARQYICLCLLLGALLYLAVDWVGTQLLWLGLPTVLIAHFTLNFHHYLVDGVIWKQRRSPHPVQLPQRADLATTK